MENDIFWSKIGLGFGEPGAKPLPRIPRSIPPPLPPRALKIPPCHQQSRPIVCFFSPTHKRKRQKKALLVGWEDAGGGGTASKSDGAGSRRISRTPLKGTRILFYGRVPNSRPPLRGTNSKLYNWHCKFQSVIKITFEHFLLKDFLKLLS